MHSPILFCTCCGVLADMLDPVRLQEKLVESLGRDAPEIHIIPRLCRDDGARQYLGKFRQAGESRGLLIAGCSFSARGREAVKGLRSAGLPDIPVEWVDLREGCAFIHRDNPAAALRKAESLLRMGLAGLARRSFAVCSPAPQERRVAVLGAGPAGLAAAKAAAGRGVPVTLVEKRPKIGGMLPMLRRLFPDFSLSSDLLNELSALPAAVAVNAGASVIDMRPVPEGFEISLGKSTPDGRKTESVRVGAVILAVGAVPVLPKGYCRYGEVRGVSSQMELETLLAEAEKNPGAVAALPKRALFLQCVGARDEANPYCSAVCCPSALKNGLRLLELVPEAEITVLHRNIVTPGAVLEDLYRRATAKGLRFRSLDPEVPPEILGNESFAGVRVKDAVTGADEELAADMLVCSTPLKPAPDAAALAKMLGVRRDDMGFLCGEEPVHPLETPISGVFICGSIRWPCTAAQAAEEGEAAGLLAASFLSGKQGDPSFSAVFGDMVPAQVKPEYCSCCGRCRDACPHGACIIDHARTPDAERPVMGVLSERCRGCGNCAAVCPTGAIFLPAAPLAGMAARVKEALR